MPPADHRRLVPPSAAARAAAQDRLDALAIPRGALGRLGDLAVWLAGCQARCPPQVPHQVRAVVFAGDHGVAADGVSAYPREVTRAMVRTIVDGRAGISVLARLHEVSLRVLDIGVDDDPSTLPASVTTHKIRRSSEAIHRRDACSRDEVVRALDAGRQVADEEIRAGGQLLIAGDLGIGNTTVAAALIAAATGSPSEAATGRGTGVDDSTLAHKQQLVRLALDRAGVRSDDPVKLLASLGSVDIAAATGFLVAAARAGVPVLLDGVVAAAEALLADRLAPGAAAWFAAGHRSTEPGQALALAQLGLEPLLDLEMRLGEGSGAVAAVPLVRAAAALLGEVALLGDLAIETTPPRDPVTVRL